MTKSYRAWTGDEDAILARMMHAGYKTGAIADELKRPYKSVDGRIQKLKLSRYTRDGPQVAVSPAEPEFSSPLTKEPLSVEQIVEMFKIDLSVWEPYHVTPNVWQVGAKHPETGAILVENLYQTKVRFRRKPEAPLAELAAELIADILEASEHRPRATHKVALLSLGGERFALEPDLFDIHLAKYAWGEETGSDYDSDLAERIATAAMTDLLAQAKPYPISEVILPLGNDFFHYDNPQGQTTAGTPLDRDTRFQRMFRIGCGLARWMIERCAEIAPTKVIVVPGNHDTTTAFTLGVVMEAEYRHDPRVTFDNSPKPRKYHRYGKNLLGFAHGHGEKPDAYPQLMALEEAEAWALTTYREMHLGHFHTGKRRDPISVDDKTSVTLRWIRSLAGTDAWHAGKGFVGRRHAEAFLWREAGGMRAHFVTLPVSELLEPVRIKPPHRGGRK